MCPHSWFPQISKSWECAGQPSDVQAIWSPKRPQDRDVAPSAWSLKLCVWTVRLSCVNLQCWGSVEKSGWRVCNTDHTGSKWRTSAPAENPVVPWMCCEWKTCFTGEFEISPCLRSCQLGFVSLEGANSIFHCMINDVLHLERAISTVSSWQPQTVVCKWKYPAMTKSLLMSEESPQPGLSTPLTGPKRWFTNHTEYIVYIQKRMIHHLKGYIITILYVYGCAGHYC